ncbi:16S rRNA (uracil(1498)-N(3))-methyltransferase [Sulfurovum sp. bin170]|uniref:16S rRNA (uracil(1498)-N(3))-methyltransferase n=1 Tax=Sulfurovum sp. bin170 TaxID=2695268 RepID=UPI0013DFEF84|nr:16S rRNA (uracil(1498)-N(3))-methyltransferase [Sulfurovum sp. bin170]
MQYLYHKQAKESTLLLKGDDHRYIFKVRRHREGEVIALRNLEDENIYYYKIDLLDKKEAHLVLQNSEKLVVKAKKKLHIGWCVIDPKSIEKILPTLNEMGVEQISFIYCQRSQKSFKLDFSRFEKILLNSSQQCGRSELMKLVSINSLEKFLKQNPDAMALNFSDKFLDKDVDIETIVVGCEGGFTKDEMALFVEESIIGFDSPLILKSESAVCVASAKLLL